MNQEKVAWAEGTTWHTNFLALGSSLPTPSWFVLKLQRLWKVVENDKTGSPMQVF